MVVPVYRRDTEVTVPRAHSTHFIGTAAPAPENPQGHMGTDEWCAYFGVVHITHTHLYVTYIRDILP